MCLYFQLDEKDKAFQQAEAETQALQRFAKSARDWGKKKCTHVCMIKNFIIDNLNSNYILPFLS